MNNNAHKFVTITILTYNRCGMLSELLKSLSYLKYPNLEIIVVDNCSTDNTQDMVKKLYPLVRYIKTLKNIGVSARNSGIRKAKGDIIITIDDDIIGITDEHIYTIIDLFDNVHDLAAINFKIIDPSNGNICNWVHHCKVEEYHDKDFLTYEITEGAVAFRKHIFDLSGYYPEEYFISHEGLDIAFRIYENNYKIIYTCRVVVKHFFARDGRENWRNYYYDTRNQIYLSVKYFPFLYGFRYLSRGLTTMLIYSIRDGFFRYWLKALFDAANDMPRVYKKRNTLGKKTMEIIKEIDSKRPSIFYMVKQRIIKKNTKMWGV